VVEEAFAAFFKFHLTRKKWFGVAHGDHRSGRVGAVGHAAVPQARVADDEVAHVAFHAAFGIGAERILGGEAIFLGYAGVVVRAGPVDGSAVFFADVDQENIDDEDGGRVGFF
jgi:hypothetical protein